MSAQSVSLADVTQCMLAMVNRHDCVAASAGQTHIANSGSLSRARLALQTCLSLDVAPHSAVSIAAGCELLHNASLVHDDLQDRDSIRRGKPAIWSSHGADVAICVGDLMISAAYAAFADAGVSGLVHTAHKAVAKAIVGQCADLHARNVRPADLQAYEQIASDKAGALFALPLELALIAAGHETACEVAHQAACHFAIGYQILDDLDDAASDARNGELNIVNLLRAVNDADPEGSASALAHRHLQAALQLSQTLPCGSGATLQRFAEELLARFKQTAVSEPVYG